MTRRSARRSSRSGTAYLETLAISLLFAAALAYALSSARLQSQKLAAAAAERTATWRSDQRQPSRDADSAARLLAELRTGCDQLRLLDRREAVGCYARLRALLAEVSQ